MFDMMTSEQPCFHTGVLIAYFEIYFVVFEDAFSCGFHVGTDGSNFCYCFVKRIGKEYSVGSSVFGFVPIFPSRYKESKQIIFRVYYYFRFKLEMSSLICRKYE